MRTREHEHFCVHNFWITTYMKVACVQLLRNCVRVFHLSSEISRLPLVARQTLNAESNNILVVRVILNFSDFYELKWNFHTKILLRYNKNSNKWALLSGRYCLYIQYCLRFNSSNRSRNDRIHSERDRKTHCVFNQSKLLPWPRPNDILFISLDFFFVSWVFIRIFVSHFRYCICMCVSTRTCHKWWVMNNNNMCVVCWRHLFDIPQHFFSLLSIHTIARCGRSFIHWYVAHISAMIYMLPSDEYDCYYYLTI